MNMLKRDSAGWHQISVSNQGRIANSFSFHILGNDLFIAGKKTQLKNNGLGLLHAVNGLVISIDEGVEALKAELTVFPNPAENRVNFKISKTAGENAELFISDLSGKRIRTLMQPEDQSGDELIFSADVSQLPAGLYFVTLTSGYTSATKKFVKVN